MGQLFNNEVKLKQHARSGEERIRRVIDKLAFDILEQVAEDGFEVCRHLQFDKTNKRFTARINITVKTKMKDGEMDLEPFLEVSEEGEPTCQPK